VRLPRELPRWLSRRRIAGLGIVVAAGVGGVLWWERHVYTEVLDKLGEASEASANVRSVVVRGWADARISEAHLLSRVLASRPAAARGVLAPDSVLLASIIATGQFEFGWILDASGTIVAAAPVQPTPAQTPSTDTATARVVVTTDGRAMVDFTAPVLGAHGSLGRVVLRAPISLTEFPFLRVLSMSSKSEVSMLLAPRGDSATVLTVGVHPDTKTTTRGAIKLPAWTQAVFVHQHHHGTGAGVMGTPATYGAAVVPGLGWLVVRQIDVSDVAAQLSEPLWINDAVFGLIIVLILVAVAALWRTRYSWRVSESARLRSEFVSSVSHELRTPLTQIRMYSEMLLGGLLTERAETERALRVIDKEATRLGMLVDRTLNFARPSSTAAASAPAETDVAQGVRDALTAFAPLAAEHDVHVLVDVPADARARIDADPLQQILLNLLENAVKYGPRGQTIRVGATASGDVTRIWVEDQGPGVPAAERDSIWRAFHRGRTAERSTIAGYGMGLAVVRDLATQFGGRASVQSAGDAQTARDGSPGARFVIDLPAA
jgi:signal transduction histidine kinase